MTTEQDGRQDLQNDNYAFPGARFSRSGAPAGHGMGMTLRDWFAGQALAGICANTDWMPTDVESVTRDAYAHADAMLAARSGDSHDD